MAEYKNYFIRFEIINKTKVIDTQRCVAVGFLNIGVAGAFLNTLFPIPTQNPNNSYNMVWFPMNAGERDATRYEVIFDRNGQKRVLVAYKEPEEPITIKK